MASPDRQVYLCFHSGIFCTTLVHCINNTDKEKAAKEQHGRSSCKRMMNTRQCVLRLHLLTEI